MSHYYCCGNNNKKGLGKSSKNSIHDIRGIQVQRLLQKLKIIETYFPWLTDLELNNFGDDDSGKHGGQEASILNHLQRIGAFHHSNKEKEQHPQTTTKTKSIELGAGTGRLSDRLQQMTMASMDHILIDRFEFEPNQCRDRVLRARALKLYTCRTVERVVMDIAVLELDEYCKSCDSNVFVMSKHLCGPACDLAISALGRSTKHVPTVIATCCHYLCTWQSFEGQPMWKALQLTEEDFEVAVAASQWASVKLGGSSKKKRKKEDDTSNNNSNGTPLQPATSSSSAADSDNKALPNLLELAKQAGEAVQENCDASNDATSTFVPSEEFERTFAREQKAELGMRLKRLLDLARAAHLQQLGYPIVELIRYTTHSVDDRLLVAYSP